ncbi:MAG: GIY-YIG nuclease family protein [Patescibacteria group bacterium]|nr:GIY-YIG nuclease family protein [Patescibacteria group bacterium]MDD2757832.1 GIY-YIG nuclease family protein [Patescibacteria group bacterium]
MKKESVYFVYALYNPICDKIYIGQTVNLDERLKLHNQKIFRGYTSNFEGSWVVIYKEEVNSRQEALKREKQLKSFRGREFVKQLIPG